MVDGEEKMVIWGSTVDVDTCREKFRDFLLFFKKSDLIKKQRLSQMNTGESDDEDTEMDKELKQLVMDEVFDDDEPFYPRILHDVINNLIY